MTKHIMALTCEQKIEAVRKGEWRQTIRPVGKREIKPGDKVMFHGWEGRPYRSTWSWRTEYFEIEGTMDIRFAFKDKIWVRGRDKYMHSEELEWLASEDGFETVEDMFKWFSRTYGHKLYDMAFRVMWW